MQRTILRGLLFGLLAVVILTGGTASATTQSVSVGGGTLSWTVTTSSGNCGYRGQSNWTEWGLGSFTFLIGGRTYLLSGGGAYFDSPGPPNCPPSGVVPAGGIDLTGSGFIAHVNPQSGGYGYATINSFITGYVNPKYVIVGVTYAPPGPSSNVTYSNSTLVGNTTETKNSFQNDANLYIAVSGKVSAWAIVGGAAVEITGSESTDYVQGSSTDTTVTISKQTTVSDTTNGTGNAFSPVNHDYDTIWLWLNPLMIYSVFPDTPKSLQWNGYGYDNHDINGPDVVGIQVGWLNGHFGSNPSINAILARSWVTRNEPGMTWPAGEGPGITSADIGKILQADPFTSGSYVLPSPLPSTSADKRFTQVPYPPNPVNYIQAGPGNGGGTTGVYNSQYVNTSSVAQGTLNKFTQAFGLDTKFSGGTWFSKFSLEIKITDTLEWDHTWQNTLTSTQTLTKNLSVTGPGCPQTSPPCNPLYSGPGEFIVFQDNLYGTFMFYPLN